MWAQMLSAPFTFEQVETAAPTAATLRAGQVLLETAAGAICGSDLPNFRGAPFRHPQERGGWGASVAGFPLHEVVGKVVASRHAEHEVGDMVVGWASGFDGIAELVLSDGEGLARYDSSLPACTAVMIQPLACVLYAAEQLGDIRGRRAAVIGQGPIGLLFSHVLKQRGVRHVVGVDRVDRSEVNSAFAVDEAVTTTADRWAASLGDAERPDVVIEAVGHQVGTMRSSLEAAAFGAQIFYFGIPDDLVYPFDMMTFLRKNLTLRAGATIERRRVLKAADDYLRAHHELREAYVSDVFAAADVQNAFEAATRPRAGQYKIALDMS
jgi:L-iditol 2-dehydrogenase